MDGGLQVATIECPRGRYPARVDDKGRVKLPVNFAQYFGALREKKLFVTSIDRRTAQIYTLDVWRQNEKTLAGDRENAAAARKVLFNAGDLGAETEMDNQGRILLSPELRRELGIENQPVHLLAYKGHVEVLSEQAYEARKLASSKIDQEEIDKLEAAGLN